MEHKDSKPVSRAGVLLWVHGTFHLMLRRVSEPGSLEYYVGPHVIGAGIAGLRNDQFIDPLSKKIKGTCLNSLSEREQKLQISVGWGCWDTR